MTVAAFATPCPLTRMLLATHLAALQRRPGGAADGELFGQTVDLYERGAARGWPWHRSLRRWLLRCCWHNHVLLEVNHGRHLH